LFEVTGRSLVPLLAQSPCAISPEQMKSCLDKLRGKQEELFPSIQGSFMDHRCNLLSALLRTVAKTVAGLEKQIEAHSERQRKVMQSRGPLIERTLEVTGISEVSAGSRQKRYFAKYRSPEHVF
jgi:hypothetical protein